METQADPDAFPPAQPTEVCFQAPAIALSGLLVYVALGILAWRAVFWALERWTK